MIEVRLRSTGGAKWDEFMDFVDQHAGADWMFRGVGDKDKHLLIPKVGRPSVHDPYEPGRERAIFKTFKRRAGLYLDRPPVNDLGWLALAQHHGLPTRLLDWSSNPLVAAFFAVSGGSSATARVYAARVSGLALIDAADKNAPDPFDGISEVSFVIPSAHIRRIAHQRGFFTIHPVPGQPWKPFGQRRAISHHQFDIDAEVQRFFQRKLFALGITSSSIMDDLDGLARTLEWQYRTDTAVGGLSY